MNCLGAPVQGWMATERSFFQCRVSQAGRVKLMCIAAADGVFGGRSVVVLVSLGDGLEVVVVALLLKVLAAPMAAVRET